MGAEAAMLWAFIGGSAVELVAVHVVLPWETVRLVADILGIWGLVWMLGYAASLYIRPHLVDAEGLHVRNGHAVTLVIPWDAIGSVRSRETSRASSRRVQVESMDDGTAAVHVMVAKRTNLHVMLTRPVDLIVRGSTETVTELHLFADEPRALVGRLRQGVPAT